MSHLNHVQDLFFIGSQFDTVPTYGQPSGTQPKAGAKHIQSQAHHANLSFSASDVPSKATQDLLSPALLFNTPGSKNAMVHDSKHDKQNLPTSEAHVRHDHVADHNQGQRVSKDVQHLAKSLSPASSKDSMVVHPDNW